jgi:hypothetical protein
MKVILLRIGIAAAVALCNAVLPASSLTAGHAAHAQTVGATLRDVHCDDADFPALVCDVALPPLTALDDATLAADVIVKGRPASDTALRRLIDPARRIEIAVVFDAYAPRLRASQQLALRDAVFDLPGIDAADVRVLTRDGIALLLAELGTSVRRSRLREARTAGPGRLLDAACDAIEDLSRAPVQDRVLLIVSSGLDARSTRCGEGDIAARAIAAGVAVMSVGTGTARQTQQLAAFARRTQGVDVSAAALDDIGAAWTALLARTGARYRISATVMDEPDGQTHSAQLRLRSGAIVYNAIISYTALPARPVIADPALHIGGRPVDAAALPDASEIVLTPRIVARSVARVEYVRAGRAESVLGAPYTTTIATDSLPDAEPTTLLVRVYGDHAGTLLSERVVQLARAGTPASAQLRPGSAVRARLPTRSVWIVLGVLSVAMLAISAWIAARARREAQTRLAPVTRGVYGPPVLSLSDAPTICPAPGLDRHVARADVERTLRIAPAPPAALLRVLDGAGAGREIIVPVAGAVTLGRGPDASERLDFSTYVSASHARVEMRPEGLMVTDLVSSNGTRVNGALLAPGSARALRDGDRLACADVEMAVHHPMPGR